MLEARGAQLRRNLQLARHNNDAHTRRGRTAHARRGILESHALSRVNAQTFRRQKIRLRVRLGVSGLIVANNHRERALGCRGRGAASHGGGRVRDDGGRNLRIVNLREETLNAGQELDRLLRQGLAHLCHQSIVNLLVRQVHAALA